MNHLKSHIQSLSSAKTSSTWLLILVVSISAHIVQSYYLYVFAYYGIKYDVRLYINRNIVLEGGTLDLTAQRVVNDTEMEVMCTAQGGSLGGSRVNNNIMALLREAFGKETMDNFKTASPLAFLEMMSAIELKKKSVCKDKQIPMNIMFCQEFAETCRISLNASPAESLSEEMKMKGFKVRSSTLSLPHSSVISAFNEVTQPITAQVDDLLKRSEVEGVTHIMMVGGFSDFKIIQEQMKQKFSPEYTVLVLDDASSVIMKGAVLYGHNPDIIKARRATKTYAVELWPPFVEGQHPESRKVKSYDGQFLVKCGLHTLVTRGEVIHTDETRRVAVTPVYVNQPSIPIKLFKTDKIMVEYADEPGLKQVATCVCKLPGTGMNREALVKFKFGGTAVEVTAVNSQGEEVTASCSFLED